MLRSEYIINRMGLEESDVSDRRGNRKTVFSVQKFVQLQTVNVEEIYI